MKVSTRLRLGLGFLVVLLVLLATAGLAAQSELAAAMNRIIEQNVAVGLAAEKMARALDRQDAAVYALGTGNVSQRAREQFAAAQQQLAEAKDRAEQSMGAASARERGCLADIEREQRRYDTLVNSLLASSGDAEAKITYADTAIVYEELERLIRELSDASNARNQQTALEAKQIAWRTRVWVSIVCAVAFAAMIWLATHLQNWIIDPLTRMSRAAQAVGEGKTHVRLQYNHHDELGELALRVNALLDDAERKRQEVAQHSLQVDQIIEAWLERQKSPLGIVMDAGRLAWANSRFREAMEGRGADGEGPEGLETLETRYQVERTPLVHRGVRQVGCLLRLRARESRKS